MPESSKSIVEQIQQYQLLNPGDEKYLKQWQSLKLSPSKGLMKLVQDKKLTKYQATSLLEGNGAHLRMGNYVILGQLGEGAMGRVLKARHIQMGRIVAIKTLTKQTAERPINNKRFENEIRFVSQLSHPNIVQAYDAGIHEGVPYLVNECIEGIDLQQLVTKSGPLSISATLHYMVQTANALGYAHTHNIIHRDVKPANLMVNNEGQIKLLDLGLARLTSPSGDESVDQTLTEEHVIVGSCAFMAPELVKSPKAFSPLTDIYGLGCTLFYLLNGRIPYSGKSYMETFIAHTQAPIPRLCDISTPVGAQLNNLFQRMLSKQPQQRIQTMAAVESALKKLIEMGQDKVPAIASPQPMPGLNLGTKLGESTVDSNWTLTEEIEPWYRRIETKILALIVVMIAVLGGTFWYMNPGRIRNSNQTKKHYAADTDSGTTTTEGGASPLPSPSGPIKQEKKAIRTIRVGE